MIALARERQALHLDTLQEALAKRKRVKTMSKTLYGSVCACAATAATLVAVWSHAGPMVPAPSPPPEEALSLREARQFRLEPILLTPILKDAGVESRRLEKLISRWLLREGIELGDDPALPFLAVTILTDTDPDQPGSVAVTIIMAAHQRVHVDRIDRSLTVPTATMGNIALTTTDRLSDAVDRELQQTIRTLLGYIRWASRPS
ncbi:MAG: hypothetical protein CMJ18_24645 [Phycisphaeraceae bacterium]|nr:hypothetical protein [Phycisphaeraceae bacterium]